MKILKILGEKFKVPEDWAQLVKILQKKERKIYEGILEIPNKIDLLDKHRAEIMKMKVQWFGKGKISMTTIAAGWQRESRDFANLFALIVMVLKEVKKGRDELNITPVRGGIKQVDESSNLESEDLLPKESWDETNSYYPNALSSNEPTPEQPAIKKSPLKKKKNSPSSPKSYVKKGYLSSDNQSTGSNYRRPQNIVNDYSPKPFYQPKTKKVAHASKRTVNLNSSSHKPTLPKPTSEVKFSTYKKISVKTKPKTKKIEFCPSSQNLQTGRKSEGSYYSETSEEEEDPLSFRKKVKPSLRVYARQKDGGMLYAFLDLILCPKPRSVQYAHLEKYESYNEAENNFTAYKDSVVNVGISGVQRQLSAQPESQVDHRLSDEDYQRIMELKNQRMKGIFK